MSPVGTAPALIDDSEDTEITLGTGKMLVLFFAQVILCAMFFGMGYSMGSNSRKSTAELLPSPSTSRSTRALPTGAASQTPQPGTQAAQPDQQQQTSPDASAGTSQSATASSSPDQSAAAGQAGGSAELQPGAGYFVQVAAVSKQEDALALVESLKARQYQAFIADPTPDKLFHVQVGPFSDVKEAETMRTRLMNDGYNPILKK
ncbi:MAG TPA: SPOR domain-containing protein [Terriglobales bacterium]|jgi:cell division septation protein DedD